MASTMASDSRIPPSTFTPLTLDPSAVPMMPVTRPIRSSAPFPKAALIMATAKARARGATVVVIAHRRGVLAAADRLLVLDAGRPRMLGPAAEVAARLAGPKSEDDAA